jgi:hypothetical protein
MTGMHEASSKTYYCASPRSFCFCTIVFLIVYGIGFAGHPQPESEVLKKGVIRQNSSRP